MKAILLKIYDYLMIHWKVVVITLLTIVFLDTPKALFQTTLVIVALELIALQIYEYIIRFVFTNKFLLEKFHGGDGKFSIMETAGLSQFQASALLSAHILVGIASYGIYFTQIAP